MFVVLVMAASLVSTVYCDSCSRHCNRHGPSVCGTDGKTYKNQCYLNVAICSAHKHHTTLALAHNGSCGSLDHTTFNCDALCDEEGQKQYCSNDGKTYASMCDLQNAACVASKHHHHITVAHAGPCLTLNGTCAKYNASCHHTHDYKCGTNGYTYTNECYLKQVQCRQIAAGSLTPVTLLHDGRCGYASTNQSRNVDCSQYADMSLAGVAIEGLSVKINDCSSFSRNSLCVDGRTYTSECDLCYRFSRYHRISYANLTVPISHDGHCHYQPIIG